jgi:RNA polymerase sigma factor (sigma-70 family)
MTMVDNMSEKDIQSQYKGFAEDTDEELILYMADQEKNPAEARGAWEEFYRRHARYVLGICRQVCNGMLDHDKINGIMVDTFQKAYLSANTYKLSSQQSADKIRRRVRAWLGVIAKHATIDVLRGQRDSVALQLEPEDWKQIDSNQNCPVSKDTEIVQKLMEQVLDERERVVLRTTYVYYKPGKENQRLPDDVVEQLCRSFCTTPENLRRIRKKATEKMKKALIETGYKNHKIN